MSDLKLEVGKWYLKRNGVITNIESKTNNSEYPFHCLEGYAYSPTGKALKGCDRSEEIIDLAKEITEPKYEIIKNSNKVRLLSMAEIFKKYPNFCYMGSLYIGVDDIYIDSTDFERLGTKTYSGDLENKYNYDFLKYFANEGI